MKRKIAAGIALSMSLAFAGATAAHPGEGRGMQHGMRGGMEHGMRGQGEGRGHEMTAEERTAFHEKMRNATPEERCKLADARRAEMHKR
ncbi:MAG: hypothetical protein ACT4PS_06800 [Betaproteobacteria bacterium]